MALSSRNFSIRNAALSAAVTVATFAASDPTLAQICPFDNGGSTLAVDGLILSRYALGITGAPLVANTGIAAASAGDVQDSITSPVHDLRITGNATMTVADATIISRKIAGLRGSALTDGLNLGSGTRSNPTAVQSFLLAGCTGTAWTQGGNAFGAPGVMGTTDAQNLTVRSGGTALSVLLPGGDGLRITQDATPGTRATNTIGGSAVNTVNGGVIGATIGGGGYLATLDDRLIGIFTAPNVITANFATIGGGIANAANGPHSTISGGTNNTVGGLYGLIAGGASNSAGADDSVVSGGRGNSASGLRSSVGGGTFNTATNQWSRVGGGESNIAGGAWSAIGGGKSNMALSTGSTIAGGASNDASAFYASVLGGFANGASANYATVIGGQHNLASGINSLAGGYRAKANLDGSFVWADRTDTDFSSTAAHQFRIRATGGAQFVTAVDGVGAPTRTVTIDGNGTLDFGSNTRQNINLWGGGVYGIGVQSGTQYFRTDGAGAASALHGFSWHRGGVHLDSANAPGVGGAELMRLASNGDLSVKGSVSGGVLLNTSDRNVKSLIQSINPQAILAKVATLPISQWMYTADAKRSWHLGPMAQDFRAAFGLGQDDKTIATVDAGGVALAAIQGLHQLVKDKDAKIGALEKANALMQKKLATIERRLGL